MGAVIGAIISAIGTALSLRQQSKQRQEARRKNKEQQGLEALLNLISVAQGGSPRRVNAQPVLPQVDYGSAISNIGGIINQSQASNAAKIRQNKLDKIAEDKAKALIDLQNSQKLRNERALLGSGDSNNPFARYKVEAQSNG